MNARRLAFALAVLLAPVLCCWQPAGGQSKVPSSIALVYPEKKIFKAGDWVLYKVYGQNEHGESSVDYQQVQIGVTQRYRGEDCFWLETGWGPDRERMDWGAVMLSEYIFQDSLADLRGNAYMRKLHFSNAPDGTPMALQVRPMDPRLQKTEDLAARKPTYTEVGVDTVDTPKGPIVCNVVEVLRIFRTARDTADSTMQTMTEARSRRWYNVERIPITGLVREEETKVYSLRAWPLGRPSDEYPMSEVGRDVFRVELLDYGRGAKPRISDRIRDTRETGGALGVE